MQFETLPRPFYDRTADVVAPEMLGHFLLRRVGDEWIGGEIVETEAYLVGDPACHAYVRETPRNRVMFHEPGFAYVYRIYGGYFCVNAVCQPVGVAEAVLIRAIEPRFGVQTMRHFRPMDKDRDLVNGPSKLCISLDIKGPQNGMDLTSGESHLIIARNPDREKFLQERVPHIKTTRIGLTKAVDWPLRWYLGGSTAVSKKQKLP